MVTKPLTKAEIKTLRSIRHNTKKTAWASMGKFDIVYMRRLQKRGFVNLDVFGVGPETPGFRWHVQMTPEGRAVLDAIVS